MAEITSLSSINIGNKPYTLAASEIVGAVTTSGGLTAATGYAKNGAITEYVDTKISETISETIDIASEITADTKTSAIPDVGAVTGYIGTKIAGVYKVKGSSTIAALPAGAEIGDVYNITGASGILDGQNVYSGDNVVKTDEGWDKLAASVSLAGYATEEWVNSLSQPYTALTATSGNWNNAYNYVTGASANLASASGYAVDWNTYKTDKLAGLELSANQGAAASGAISAAVSTSADMAVAGNTGKLATVGAITGYIDNTIKAANKTISGGNGVTADLVGDVYQVSGINATTAAVGVVKKAYVTADATTDTVGKLVFPE